MRLVTISDAEERGGEGGGGGGGERKEKKRSYEKWIHLYKRNTDWQKWYFCKKRILNTFLLMKYIKVVLYIRFNSLKLYRAALSENGFDKVAFHEAADL